MEKDTPITGPIAIEAAPGPDPGHGSMIAVEDLVFEYPGLRALDGVSFGIEPGGITALVGPTGAGKTTLMRCMAALMTPLAGRVLMDGFDVHEAPRKSHREMGYLSDFFGLYDALTVRQCLRYQAMAQGVAAVDQGPAVEQAAAQVRLSERMGRRPARCPGACANAWPSPRRSCIGPGCCCSTSRPPASIRRRGKSCRSCSAA